MSESVLLPHFLREIQLGWNATHENTPNFGDIQAAAPPHQAAAPALGGSFQGRFQRHPVRASVTGRRP